MPHSTAKSAAFSIRHGWVSCVPCRPRWWWCSTSPWCCSSSPPSSAWTSTAGRSGALTSSAASTGVHTHAGRVNAVHATSYFYPKNFIGANVCQMHISVSDTHTSWPSLVRLWDLPPPTWLTVWRPVCQSSASLAFPICLPFGICSTMPEWLRTGGRTTSSCIYVCLCVFANPSHMTQHYSII